MTELPDLALLYEGKPSYLRELELVLADGGVQAHIIQPPGSKPSA